MLPFLLGGSAIMMQDNSSERILVNGRLIEKLAAHGAITAKAREYALNALCPRLNWGLWIARLLSTVGVALILSGIVYFFAFNWAKISPAIKLGSLELAMFACLIAAYASGLQRCLSGRLLLLSASALVGVLLAVFGQVYQTGADAYQLFMMWAILIIPWTIISEFTALWLLWLGVVNTFIILWWTQTSIISQRVDYTLFSWLIIFNCVFLGLREYASGIVRWIGDRYSRLVLVIAILIYALIPLIAVILEEQGRSLSMRIGALLALGVHAGFYGVFRFKRPDMPSLAAIFLSACIVVEVAIGKAAADIFPRSGGTTYLIVGPTTLGVFTLAVYQLRCIGKTLESHHG